MKKLLKFIGILVVITIVLIVAAVIVLPMVFDPNDRKDEIAAQFKEKTGRDLQIAGDLKLSVFPWLGVDMGPVMLGNAPGFGDEPFAKTGKTQVRVKIKPLLLDRRLEMDTVVIKGLTLNLARNKQGVGNWEDLAKGGGGKASSGEMKESESGPGLAALAIGGVDISDANFNWSDAQSGQSASVNNLSIQTGPVTLGSPVDLNIAFDLSESGGAKGHVTLVARLDPDLDKRIFRATGIELNANLTGEQLPGGEQTLAMKADASADLGKQTLDVTGLSVTGMGLNATGNLAATGIQSKPAYTGKLSVAAFNARELLASLGQSVPETADANALTKVALDIGLAGGADRVTLKPLGITLDDSKLAGSAGVANFAKPAIRFDLNLDAIDADRYLPPPAQGATAATPGAAAPAAGELPLESLRALDIDGKAKIGQLTIKKLKLNAVNATLKAKNGLITLNPVGADLYEGNYRGNIALDARGKVLKVKVDEKLAGVKAGPLLTDLQGAAPIDGTANASVTASTSGTDPEAIKRSLNGNLKFAFTDGAINGINIPAMIRKAKATLSGGSAPAAEGPQKTDFSELTGSAKIVNGKINNPDLLAKSPFLRIEGKGDADLPGNSVDYGVKTTLVASMAGQGGDDLKDLVGVPIPIRVTGKLDDPSIGLDTEALLKSQVAAKLAGQKGKVKEKVQKKITEKLGGKLGGGAAEKAGGALKGLFN